MHIVRWQENKFLYVIIKGIPNGFPYRMLWRKHAGCCEAFEKRKKKQRKNTRASAVDECFIALDRTQIDSLWESIHTRLDRSQFALRKFSHSFRSISVCFEKVFTLVYIDLSLLWESVHTCLDLSQFTLRKCSHWFRSISVCFEKVFTLV